MRVRELSSYLAGGEDLVEFVRFEAHGDDSLKLLVERGADRSIKDDLYHLTAEGHAEYFGQVEVRDYLRSLGA